MKSESTANQSQSFEFEEIEFEEIEHTADWALRIYGWELSHLFSNAARGMNSLLVDDPETIPLDITEKFELNGVDAESLLVNWLSELAYWAEMEQTLFREFEMSLLTATRLHALARGGQVAGLKKHIKAVTYHNLKFTTTTEGMLTVTVVFDV